MKNKLIFILILFLFLLFLPLIISQSHETNDNPEQNVLITHFQTSFICLPPELFNELTNSQNALSHCFTYTILGINNSENIENTDYFIYDEQGNYWFKEGVSYHFIFYNESYDTGFTNISYDEFIKISNWIEDNLELIYEIKEEYLYDSDGNRLLKKVVKTGTNESVYYIGDDFVQVRNSTGIYNTTYYYADNVLVAEKDKDGKRKYYHPDHLGSTNLITNSTGGIVEETFYLPFGDVLEGGDESRYGYNEDINSI